MNHTRRRCRSIRTHFGEHFHALGNQLARRVLQREYSERWRPTAGTVVVTDTVSVDADYNNDVTLCGTLDAEGVREMQIAG